MTTLVLATLPHCQHSNSHPYHSALLCASVLKSTAVFSLRHDFIFFDIFNETTPHAKADENMVWTDSQDYGAKSYAPPKSRYFTKQPDLQVKLSLFSGCLPSYSTVLGLIFEPRCSPHFGIKRITDHLQMLRVAAERSFGMKLETGNRQSFML